MTDLTIFAIGCFVTFMIVAAVGLLLWGAAQEERGTLRPESWTSDSPGPEAAPTEEPPTPEAVEPREPGRAVG